MADSSKKDVIGGGGLFTDYQRPPPRASTALGLMPIHSSKNSTGASGPAAANSALTPSDFSKVIGGTVAVSDEVRSSAQYADWYYAQNPRDPRTPPPLIKGGKYGAVARSNIHGPIGSPVPHASTAATNNIIISNAAQSGGIQTTQPPSIPLSAAPGKTNRYQPPSQRTAGANAPAIPIAKAPAAVGASKVASPAPAPPAGKDKIVGGPKAQQAPASGTGINPLMAGLGPKSSSAATATTNTTALANASTTTTTAAAIQSSNPTKAASPAPATTQAKPVSAIVMANDSIPEGEEPWGDDLVEETIASITTAPRQYLSSRPHTNQAHPTSSAPAPPSEAFHHAAHKSSNGPTPSSTTGSDGPVTTTNATAVVSGGQQFSLYAKPFQPPTSAASLLGRGGSASATTNFNANHVNALVSDIVMGPGDDEETSQYYAAMRSISGAGAGAPGVIAGAFGVSTKVSLSPAATNPASQGFTPYPQPTQFAYGRSSNINSPSAEAATAAGLGVGVSPFSPHSGGLGLGVDSGYESHQGGGWYGAGNPTAADMQGGAAQGFDELGMGGMNMGMGMGGGDFGMYGGGGMRGSGGMRGGAAGGRRGGRGGQHSMGMGGMGMGMGGMSGGMRGGMGGGPMRGGHMHGAQTVGVRSPFVDKFHNEHVSGAWRLTDVEGHVAEIAKDQEGSRFVQVQLDAAAQNGTLVKQLDDVLEELFVDQATATDVICDVFGNYVVQKILEVATEAQLERIFTHLGGIIVNLTLQTYGCRVIQKAVEALRRYPALLEGVVAELEPNVPRCVQDQNGNHVIQKLVEINPDGAGFIIDAFRGKVRDLATHAYGCRVIQCILSQCPRFEPDIMRELFVCLPDLTMDQYGNYVVQHVLQNGPQSYVDICFDALKHRIYYCSRQKFASNVIEKLFHRCSRIQRQEFFDILCYCDPDVGATEQTTQQIQGKPLLSYFVLMMMDPFANYVVQKFVDEAEEPLRRQMMAHTSQYLDVLRAHHYGMHIVNRFERSRYLPQGSSTGSPIGNIGGGGGGANTHHHGQNNHNHGNNASPSMSSPTGPRNAHNAATNAIAPSGQGHGRGERPDFHQSRYVPTTERQSAPRGGGGGGGPAGQSNTNTNNTTSTYQSNVDHGSSNIKNANSAPHKDDYYTNNTKETKNINNSNNGSPNRERDRNNTNQQPSSAAPSTKHQQQQVQQNQSIVSNSPNANSATPQGRGRGGRGGRGRGGRGSAPRGL